MNSTEKKKKKVSKRNKRAWRKHTDVQDVENFLEEKRSDERLGVDKLESKKNEDLFVLDTEIIKPQGKARSRAEMRAWSREPSYYQTSLLPTSAVEDPIKRNRVRTKEERKHPARKAKDMELKAKGLMRKKAMEAKQNRIESIKKSIKERKKNKIVKFDTDVWSEDVKPSFDDSWLGPDAKRQALMGLKEFKVKPPGNLSLPRSELPKLEMPHPGLSYNPSLADHKELVNTVVEKELVMMKKDAHIQRVTAPFKAKQAVQQDEWVDDILASLGIPRKEDGTEIKQEYEELEGTEVVDDKDGIIRKPQPKMKTKKQRRSQKRLRDEALERKQAAVEKRKTSDIYQLKKIVNDIDEDSTRKDAKTAAKQEAKSEHARVGTKRLARKKFEEPLQDFTTSWQLKGSLRKLKSMPTILRDRFFSMQKRNMLQPTTKLLKKKKRSVKVFIKKSHKIQEEIPMKRKSSNKIKIINTG